MPVDSLFAAAFCAKCQHVSLLSEAGDASDCPLCCARLFLLPGVKFVHNDLPLFAALERVVHEAALSKSEATLVAAELESVSGRWEPPDLVLQRLSERLDGLSSLYDPKQDYSRLLLVAGILLTIVGARLIVSGPGPRRSSRSSGIRELAPPSPADAPVICASFGRKPR